MPCGARTRSGAPCAAPAMPNGRCRMHGGLTPTGFALPQTKTGRHSKYLPERLAAKYAEALADPELSGLRDELALVDARLADVLGRVDTGEAGAAWKRLGLAVADFNRLRSLGLPAGISEIEEICEAGLGDWAAWSEALDLVERRRKLCESEVKRGQALQQTITAERAMLLVAAVLDVIRTHVREPQTLSAIGRDVGRLVAPGAVEAAG